MRNLKKILALVLALMMVLSVMVTASAAYADADAIEHTEAVQVMSDLGILQGDGTNFKPQGTLNRAEAAVIIAKVLEGSVDNIAVLVDAVSNPFTDVPAWALDYVLYCYNAGVVVGTSATKYSPSKELTGYEFAKMLQVAAGICKASDYSADSWKTTVVENADDLLVGLEDIKLSAPLSREHAAQMALNAMKVGTTTVLAPAYYLCAGVPFATAADAYFYSQANSGAAVEYVPAEVETTALLATVFGMSWDENAVDAYGRPSANYWMPGTTYDVYFPAEAVKTYTSATTEGKIWTELGYTSAAQSITLTYYFNSSVPGGQEVVTKGDTTPVGAQGQLVQVYKTGRTTYSVVVTDTYAVQLADANLIAAVPATANTDGSPAMLWIDVDGDTVKDAGEYWLNTGFAKNQVVLYNAADGNLTNVAPAEYVTGDVTATAASYLRVNGDVKYLAATNGGSIGADAYALGATGYTYYVDTYGNIIMAVVGTPVTVAPNYTYVIATASKGKTSGTGSNLFEGTETSAAAAQAKIIDLATGEIKVVDVAITLYNGQYYYVNAAGIRTSTVVGANNVPGATGLVTYTVLEDGTYVIGSNPVTTSVTVKKDTAKVADGKYANSATVLTVVEYTVANGQITGATVTTTTGIANFPAAGKNYDAVVTAHPTTGVVSNMLVVKEVDAPIDTVDYAVFAKVGETTTISGVNFTQVYYYVGGVEVAYYAPAAYLGAEVPTAYGVYDITVSDGVLVAATPVAATNASLMTVIAVDESYILAESAGGKVYTIYFDTYGYEVYNADNNYATDVIEVEDSIWVYATKGSNQVWTAADLIVIDN